MRPHQRAGAAGLLLMAALALGTGAAAAHTGAAAPPPEVTITATEYAFAAPAHLPAGLVALTYRNAGKQPHNLKVVRLKEGKTLDDLKAATSVAETFRVVDAYGGASLTFAGQSQRVVLDLRAGQYALLSTTAGPDGVRDAQKGMLTGIPVAPLAGVPPPTEPPADIAVSLRDLVHIPFPAQVGVGAHTILVLNAGTLPHQLIVVQLQPGKTVEDLRAWVRANRAGPAPLAAGGGGTAEFSPGQRGWLPLDLPAGEYVAWCDFPTEPPGGDHFLAGEYATFSVTPGLPSTGGGGTAPPRAPGGWGLVLAGLGLAGWLGRGWQRRRQARARAGTP